MRCSLLLAALVPLLVRCNCGVPFVPEPAPVIDVDPKDAGPNDSGPPPIDAGRVEPEDDGGIRFELAATLPIRPRGVWSLDGASVWVVGDSNAIYRFDSRGWVPVAPPEGEGVDWLEVRGDRSSIWAVGERPDAGDSVLFISRLQTVRRIEAEGVSITAPHLLLALEQRGLRVGGNDLGHGAMLYSSDQGATWQPQELPDCPPIVGATIYASHDLFVGLEPLLPDSSHLAWWDHGNGTWTWERSSPVSAQAVLGPAFTYEVDDSWNAVLVGERSLLQWDGWARFGYGSLIVHAEPIDVEVKPVAVWGFAANDVWAVGGDTVAWRGADGSWSTLALAGQDLVALHGGVAGDLWIAASSGAVFHRAQTR